VRSTNERLRNACWLAQAWSGPGQQKSLGRCVPVDHSDGRALRLLAQSSHRHVLYTNACARPLEAATQAPDRRLIANSQHGETHQRPGIRGAEFPVG